MKNVNGMGWAVIGTVGVCLTAGIAQADTTKYGAILSCMSATGPGAFNSVGHSYAYDANGADGPMKPYLDAANKQNKKRFPKGMYTNTGGDYRAMDIVTLFPGEGVFNGKPTLGMYVVNSGRAFFYPDESIRGKAQDIQSYAFELDYPEGRLKNAKVQGFADKHGLLFVTDDMQIQRHLSHPWAKGRIHLTQRTEATGSSMMEAALKAHFSKVIHAKVSELKSEGGDPKIASISPALKRELCQAAHKKCGKLDRAYASEVWNRIPKSWCGGSGGGTGSGSSSKQGSGSAND